MSFIDGSIKPKLIEKKIFDRVMKVQEETKPLKINFNIWPTIYLIIKKNILSISILLVIGFLLLYRYYYVKELKKNKTKQYIESSSEED